MKPMEHLGDVAHVESRFSPFGDGVSVGARQEHGLCQMYHRVKNRFRRTRSYSKVTRLKWKLISVRLHIVLILMQQRCMVCVEHSIGSEIILDTPDGTPR
jgi:hypothetical protein